MYLLIEFCAGIMNGSILPPSQTFNSSIPDGSRSILDFSSSSVELYEINQNITEVDGTVTILMKTGNMTISCHVRPVDITITLVQSMGQNVLFANGEFLFLFDCIKTTIVQFEQMVMYENSTVTILGRNTTFPNITTFWYCDSFRCYKFSSSKSFLRSGPTGRLFTSKEVALYSIASLVNRAIEDILANPPLISFSAPVATMITTSPTIIISSSTFLTSSIFTTVMSSEETTLITPSLTKDTFDLSTLTSLPISTVVLTPTVLATPTPTVGPDIVEPTSDEPSPSTRKPEKTKTKTRMITNGKTKTTIKICTLSKTRNTETKSTDTTRMTFTGRTTKTRMTDMVKGSKDGVTVTKCTTTKTVGSTRDTTAKSKGTISRTRGSMETTRSTTTRTRGGKETTRSTTTRRRGGKKTTRSTTRRRGGMGTTRSTTTRRRGGMGTTRSTTTRRRGGMGTTRSTTTRRRGGMGTTRGTTVRTKGVVGTTKRRISELCRTKVTDKRTWSKISRCIEVHLTKSATTDDDATDIRTFDSSNSMKRPGGAKKLHLKTTFVNTLRALLVDLKKAGMMPEREIDAQHSFDEMNYSPSKYLRMKNKSKPHASAISQEDPFLKHKFVVEKVFSGRTFTYLSSKPSFHKPCTMYPPKLLAAQASSKPVLYEVRINEIIYEAMLKFFLQVLVIYVYDHDEEQGCLISCLDPGKLHYNYYNYTIGVKLEEVLILLPTEKQYEAFLWSESEDHQNGAEVQKSISIALDPEAQE